MEMILTPVENGQQSDGASHSWYQRHRGAQGSNRQVTLCALQEAFLQTVAKHASVAKRLMTGRKSSSADFAHPWWRPSCSRHSSQTHKCWAGSSSLPLPERENHHGSSQGRPNNMSMKCPCAPMIPDSSHVRCPRTKGCAGAEGGRTGASWAMADVQMGSC